MGRIPKIRRMTPEVARQILENWIKDKIELGSVLPVWDEQVAATYGENQITVWTFRELIKYIYKLQDDEQA